VLLERARERAEGAGHLPLRREVDRGRALDERALLARQLEPVDERRRARESGAASVISSRASPSAQPKTMKSSGCGRLQPEMRPVSSS